MQYAFEIHLNCIRKTNSLTHALKCKYYSNVETPNTVAAASEQMRNDMSSAKLSAQMHLHLHVLTSLNYDTFQTGKPPSCLLS